MVKRSKPRSPTARSLALLRKQHMLVGVVEKWNPHANIRQDLYGCLDLVATGPLLRPGIYGVQTTTSEHLAERVEKLYAARWCDGTCIKGKCKEGCVNTLSMLLGSDWHVHVHGWVQRPNGRWRVRVWDLATNKEIEWPQSITP